jgi:hypothetical protein
MARAWITQLAVVGLALIGGRSIAQAESLRIGTFDVDASPPIGSPLAYDPTKEVTTPLSCRGIVLLGDEAPVVLCAVDWIGIGNGGNREFRERLAAAAGTTPERVAVHTLHQHDAPWCDFSVDELAAQYGISQVVFDSAFARDVIHRAAVAVRNAAASPQVVTHIGTGIGRVEQVASNRRILGADGKVQHVRWTATKDAAVRAYPEGVIDPDVRMITFWNGDRPLVALSYYATHPQSYYRTGQATPDFPGLARNARQEATRVLHVHFNGAGGNIGAGKYNDGAQKNRQVLADRVAAGMQRAWDDQQKAPITGADVHWDFEQVKLPPAQHLDEATLRGELQNADRMPRARLEAAHCLIWLARCQQRDAIDVGCLSLGSVRILHMPGELFVEYQLAAQAMRPDLFVAMAAYGDYAPWYIGTEVAYEQGGYETSPGSSLVAPGVEGVLMGAMRKVLDADGRGPERLGVEAAAREVEAVRQRERPESGAN